MAPDAARDTASHLRQRIQKDRSHSPAAIGASLENSQIHHQTGCSITMIFLAAIVVILLVLFLTDEM